MHPAYLTRCTAAFTTILVLTPVTGLHAQIARRFDITTNAVRVVAGSSGSTSLSSAQKLSLLHEMAGALNATALANPVLLTAKQPNYADQVYVNTQNTTADSYPSQYVKWNLWPGRNADIVVVVLRALMTKPALVDCVVSATGGTNGEARLKVEKGSGGIVGEITVKGANQHLTTVLLPQDAGTYSAAVGIKVSEHSPYSLDVHSCEVTAMK
jgi:hypothetical protein